MELVERGGELNWIDLGTRTRPVCKAANWAAGQLDDVYLQERSAASIGDFLSVHFPLLAADRSTSSALLLTKFQATSIFESPKR